MTHPALGRIVASLKGQGLEVELLEEGALIVSGEGRLTLFTEPDARGGVLVRLHLDLDLLVEEEALNDVLLGMNLTNQELDYGALVLGALVSEDEDEALEEDVTFAVMGRSVLWLPSLSSAELRRLSEHLRRFESELVGVVERGLRGGGLQA